ncbi:MAG: hypothetical protein ABJB47_03140 [Actinomycetota bacterium]
MTTLSPDPAVLSPDPATLFPDPATLSLDPAVWVSEQFPGWRAWASQTGRWWAMHDADLTASQAAAGCLPLLHTYSPETLATRLREQETLRRQHPAPAATAAALGRSRISRKLGVSR